MKKNQKIIIIIIVVIIVLTIGGYFIWKHYQKKEAERKNENLAKTLATPMPIVGGGSGGGSLGPLVGELASPNLNPEIFVRKPFMINPAIEIPAAEIPAAEIHPVKNSTARLDLQRAIDLANAQHNINNIATNHNLF